MATMESAEAVGRRSAAGQHLNDDGVVDPWEFIDPLFGRAHLRVHPATRATIAPPLHPLLAQLEAIAQRGRRTFSLTQLERTADRALVCAIWAQDPHGEVHRLPLSTEPTELLEQFRVYCGGWQRG